MTWARLFKAVTKVCLAALVLGALATSGKAQSIYQGKFTLPVETRWGAAKLPAGDYTFTVSSASSEYRLYIKGEKTNAIVQTLTAETASSQHAQLHLVDIADVYSVETFDAPELRTNLHLLDTHAKAYVIQSGPSKGRTAGRARNTGR